MKKPEPSTGDDLVVVRHAVRPTKAELPGERSEWRTLLIAVHALVVLLKNGHVLAIILDLDPNRNDGWLHLGNQVAEARGVGSHLGCMRRQDPCRQIGRKITTGSRQQHGHAESGSGSKQRQAAWF